MKYYHSWLNNESKRIRLKNCYNILYSELHLTKRNKNKYLIPDIF